MYRFRRIAALIGVILIMIPIFCCPVFAFSSKDTLTELHSVTYYKDGSRTEITIVPDGPEYKGSITVSKKADHYNSSNELVWRVKLTGTFTYNGTTSSCTAASTSCTFYKSGWSVISEYTTHSGNMASNAVVLGRAFVGVTLPAAEVNLTLTCDKDGHLS